MSIPPFPPSPYDAVTVEQLEAELLVVIRHEQVRIADLPGLFDADFGALHGAAKAGLFIPVGPALAVYLGDPMGVFDLEVGFPAMGAPTADIPSSAGVVHTSALPAGRAAVLSHIGPYDGIGESWAALVAGAPGPARGVWIEVYVSDPVVEAPAHVRTDLVLPLA